MNTPIDNIENKNHKKTLSDDEAYNNFTTYFSDEMPFAIMISTSGLYNSFIDKKDFLDYNGDDGIKLIISNRVKDENTISKTTINSNYKRNEINLYLEGNLKRVYLGHEKIVSQLFTFMDFC